MSKKKLRVVFAGTPPFAAEALAGLLNNPDCEIIAVYTQPDRRANRGKKITQSAVKQLAVEHGLSVFQPENFKQTEAVEQLAALNADLMVVAAYGLLLPKTVLQSPRLGCINIHASILPRWRGAAPIERAIEAGDDVTGITIMQMDEGLDTGDMLERVEIPIAKNETGESLRLKLAKLGSSAANKVVSSLISGAVSGTKQDDSLANYARKLDRNEAEIDWSSPATILERKIRAFNAMNCCFTWLRGERLKIWQASVIEKHSDCTPGTVLESSKKGIVVSCGEQTLRLEVLQLPGGRALECHAILNSKAEWFEPGTVLGKQGGIE